MVQKARFTLKPIEQKTLIYAISKIKPTDTIDTVYTFEISDFYKVCGIDRDSYTWFKQNIQNLSDKSWWYDDGKTETLIRWFNTLKINKDSGRVDFTFHEEIMPFLIDIVSGVDYITRYELKYILPMSSSYSIRLYEILKSYNNNDRWYFTLEALKKLLDCSDKYPNFKDFKRRVLEPAVREINEYTDLRIEMAFKRNGRKIDKILFTLSDKTDDEKEKAQHAISKELDGRPDFTELVEIVREEIDSGADESSPWVSMLFK